MFIVRAGNPARYTHFHLSILPLPLACVPCFIESSKLLGVPLLQLCVISCCFLVATCAWPGQSRCLVPSSPYTGMTAVCKQANAARGTGVTAPGMTAVCKQANAARRTGVTAEHNSIFFQAPALSRMTQKLVVSHSHCIMSAVSVLQKVPAMC